jgi:hypothetical protein
MRGNPPDQRIEGPVALRADSPVTDGTAFARAQYDDDFYGFTEVRFHRHLGLAFERAGDADECQVTLPAPDDRPVSPAAAFTVAEVAGAMAVSEGLLPHAAEILAVAKPMLLTTRVHFRALADGRGTVRAEARMTTGGAVAVEKLQRVRKVKVEVEVDLFDVVETRVGTATVYCYIRMMSQELLDEWGER